VLIPAELAEWTGLFVSTSPKPEKVPDAQGMPAQRSTVDAPPAKPHVRTHEVSVIDGINMVTDSEDVPNLAPGLTLNGHIQHRTQQPLTTRR